MSLRSLYDDLSHRVELGSQLGVGGEGAVFEVLGQGSSVAKVYHKLPDARQEKKVRAMVALARPELLRSREKITWSISPLARSYDVIPFSVKIAWR